jgi:GNAT superfamily N-acetyltransferase
MITITRTDSDNPDFRALVTLLDADLRIRDGEDHAFYAQFNKIDTIKHAVVAYHNDKAVGSGAFKNYSENSAELKRMFVLPEFRRQGVAQKILNALEQWAHELGHTTCVLETGKNQPEAIQLYKKYGFQIIPNYGQYENVENSVCMKKKIIR